MVVLSGVLKGKKLPFLKGLKYVRPTKTIIRKSLFSFLGSRLAGAVCLDLFCGTASLGFEAVSQGASFVYLVDNKPRVLKAVHRFVSLYALSNVRVICTCYSVFLFNCYITFDIIFVDAPYCCYKCIDQILFRCLDLLNSGGLLYFENFKSNMQLMFDFSYYNLLRFGTKGRISFYLFERK